VRTVILVNDMSSMLTTAACMLATSGTRDNRRAVEGGNFMVAWTLAAELPKLPLADGLALLLLARDVEPARLDRGVPRRHARLCAERQLTAAEAQLALAALNALPDAGADSAAQALGAILRRHGLEHEGA
jgi:hypothetical protein